MCLPVKDDAVAHVSIRFELFEEVLMRALPDVVVPNITHAAEPEIQSNWIYMPAETLHHLPFLERDLLLTEFSARVIRELAA